MKTKAFLSIVILCIVISVLSGCQLKKPEDKNNSTAGDKLIGTIITTESLNSFDIDAYLNDNIENIINNEENVVNEEDALKYNKKIYAQHVTLTDTNDNGEKITHKEYTFDGINGMWFFDAKIPATETEESYTCLCTGGGLSNIHSNVHHTDTGVSEIELTADLYYSYEKWGTVFYMNPVYQESDGDIYCVEGSGYSVAGDKGSIDGNANGSQNISDKLTFTENGEETVYQSTITINYIPVYIPEKVSFIFMNENNTSISDFSYSPESVPEEINVPDGTEYIILLQKSHEGSIPDVIGKNCENAEYIAEDRDGFCSIHSIYLIWQ